ncbi:LOW QUALITY PROTEIN: hypothetical protein PHMEG_00012776 [Phytophthora megakarya]|uniref:Uncharacterized protein n=1 Tax=Phytophthora megakarya TaxID=4795 RepID=A0A225WA07_9STRA|nr:LOW QUALITY PROTEIN: hypothetical protein PHMEG_00012776 [Phytophthora megakarya]
MLKNITAKLSPNHPLLWTFIFTSSNVLNELNKTLSSARIPPHLEFYKKLDQQQQSIHSLPEMLENRMEYRNGVVAGNNTRYLLRKEITSLVGEVGLHRHKPTEQQL